MAIVGTLAVVLGWGLFAIDQTRAASTASAAEIADQRAAATPDPDPDQEAARERAHGRVREAIDDVNDQLLRPFAPVAASSPSRWVRRSVPALLAVIVYGFGLGLLARFTQGRL